MRKLGAFILAALLTLSAGAATTGGVPSRPRFQAVGVNAAAPATGNLTASGTIAAATYTASGNSTFSGSLTLNESGGTGARAITTSTSGCNGFFLQNAGAQAGYVAMNVGAGSCTTGAASGDVTLDATNVLRFSHNGTQHATMSNGGTFNVAGDVQVNGVSACRSDGTNCPAVAVAGAGVLSGATTTCAIGSSCSIAFNTETFDTATFHDNVTNNSRIVLPLTTGYAECSGTVTMLSPSTSAANSNHQIIVEIVVNNTTTWAKIQDQIFHVSAGQQDVEYLAVATGKFPVSGTDYAELRFSGLGYTSGNMTASTSSLNNPTRFNCTAAR